MNRTEMLTTGTVGELTPVLVVDGRAISDGTPESRPVTERLRALYAGLTSRLGEPLPF